MPGQIRFFLILLPCCILTTLHCSPSPMLQSPRVKSNISIGATWTYEETWKKLSLDVPSNSGTTGMGTRVDTIRRDLHEYGIIYNPLNVKWGIARRVEISWFFLHTLFYGFMFNGHLKIFLNEHGTPLLFRNCSYALFGGGNAFRGDVDDDKTAFVGAILATRHLMRCREIELIVQPSYFQQRFTDDGGSFDGGRFKEIGYIDGLQVNFGTMYTAVNTGDFTLEFLLGGIYRYEMTNDWRFTFSDNTQVYRQNNVMTYSPWTAQCGVIFHFRSYGG